MNDYYGLNTMGLNKFVDEPWTWTDPTCISWMYDEDKKCQGHMYLKNINFKIDDEYAGSILNPTKVVGSIHIEKVWVCDTCGEIFLE